MGAKVSTSRPAAVPKTGKKAALLFGLNYSGASQGYQLSGCINDVNDVRDLLVATGKMAAAEIVVHADDNAIGRDNTTVAGIKRNLSAIAKRSWTDALEFVYVHFSGHGCQVRDFSGDELDGLDEAIAPCDFERSGVITDDWLRDWAVGAMNPKTKLVVIFDSCHSGSALDLVKLNNRTITFISGCKDEQTAADAYNIDGRFRFTGALTASMIKALKEAPTLWADVVQLCAKINSNLTSAGYDQVPVLTTAHDTAVNKVFI